MKSSEIADTLSSQVIALQAPLNFQAIQAGPETGLSIDVSTTPSIPLEESISLNEQRDSVKRLTNSHPNHENERLEQVHPTSSGPSNGSGIIYSSTVHNVPLQLGAAGVSVPIVAREGANGSGKSKPRKRGTKLPTKKKAV